MNKPQSLSAEQSEIYMVMVNRRRRTMEWVATKKPDRLLNAARHAKEGTTKHVFHSHDEAVRYASSQLDWLLPLAWKRRGERLATLVRFGRLLGCLPRPYQGEPLPTIEYV